jgi:hypothetical protein
MREMSLEDRLRFRSFWSTVTWPRQEGFLIAVVGPVVFFVIGVLYEGLMYGALGAAIMSPVLLLLWASHRVMKAWAEWPAKRRWASWLKAAVRVFLTDSSATPIHEGASRGLVPAHALANCEGPKPSTGRSDSRVVTASSVDGLKREEVR